MVMWLLLLLFNLVVVPSGAELILMMMMVIGIIPTTERRISRIVGQGCIYINRESLLLLLLLE